MPLPPVNMFCVIVSYVWQNLISPSAATSQPINQIKLDPIKSDLRDTFTVSVKFRLTTSASTSVLFTYHLGKITVTILAYRLSSLSAPLEHLGIFCNKEGVGTGKQMSLFFLNPTHFYLLVVALNGMLNQCVTLIIEYCN